MTVTVIIPTAFRQYASGEGTVQLSGDSVGQVLGELVSQYPQLQPHLFGEDGQLRNFVNIFVNDQHIRELDQADTKISEGDEVAIVPAVAGGQHVAEPVMQAPAAWEQVELSKEEIERYSRHLIMPEVGVDGQKKLKNASILLIGAGGLGSPLGLYLGAAGVGRLGVVDFDKVDYTNLQRQIIHTTADVGRPKLQSARESIAAINPYVQVDGYETALTSENALKIIEPYDIVIDGTDNFPTRYLVNDACVLLGKPNVYGSIFRFEGQASVFHYEGGPCYRCLYPDPPPPGLVPSCAEGGVLGILPGIIGIIQATEAVKIIIGQGETLSNRLLLFDALGMKFREMKIRRDPKCPVCGDHPTVTQLIDYKQFCGVTDQPTGQHPEAQAQMKQQTEWDITVQEFKKLRDEGADFVLLDTREPHEYQICNLGGTLIPPRQFAQRFKELDSDAEIVVHCRSGERSAKIVQVLRASGFGKARNLRGGILAWADHIDPTMPKY